MSRKIKYDTRLLMTWGVDGGILRKCDGNGFSQVRSEGGGTRGVSSETQKCAKQSARDDPIESVHCRVVGTFGTQPRTRLESTDAESGDVEVAIMSAIYFSVV